MSQIYIPEGCNTLANVSEPQIRLGLQGFGGVGKTWAALTFKNPIVVNLDKGLGAHFGRPDVVEIPMGNVDYCKKLYPKYKGPESVRDVIDVFFDTVAPKLSEEQTLVFDGGTGLQHAYHKWYMANPVLTKMGKLDDFAEWRLKVVFLGDVFNRTKFLKCNFIYICHEAEKKDKDGSYSGKIRPLLTGQFCDELMSHFTDWFRCHALAKPKADVKPETLANFGLKNQAEFNSIANQFSNDCIYFWQTQSDDVCDCKASSLVNFPRYIPANSESFYKYKKNITLPEGITKEDLSLS